ncbi:DUF2157 domain-containing protein [Shewanella seohaensis]|uniref:DUF2157 domain-containing protein n=1 Tax=Shewanella seohaensis TaxID=755175 RepID=UPI00200E6E60|nr:DUF2157 domain-containing protein [Shewanella seohaensis]MCL1121362.1 DUF2157 domain-containing protein [Shewanella seohaensis]UXM81185.1 DUF2157 domain-containing protein [Shewanella seohaensis]
MRHLTSHVYEWLEQGHITPTEANELYRQLSVPPNAASWRSLLAQLLQWAGALSFACGVIFFFAYNWQSLERMSKFALIEAALLISFVSFVWLYYRSAAKQLVDPSHCLFGATLANAALLVVSMLVGGLLALVGQTYQTGADPWQLFAIWALAILPFAWVAGFDGLWLLLVGLVNLSLGLYADTTLLWLDEQLWLCLFVVLNLTIYYGFVFLGSTCRRWHAPFVECASSLMAMGCFTLLVCWMIFEPSDTKPLLVAVWVGYFGHLLFGFWWFRHKRLQVYPLALGGFSLISVGAALFTELLFRNIEPIGGFLLIGLYIILASTGLSTVLRRLHRQAKAGISPTPTPSENEELSHE